MTTENVQYWKDAHALLLDQNKKLKGYIKQIKEDGGAIIASLGDELEAEFLAPLRAENEKLKKEVKTRKSLCGHFQNLNKKNFEENKELKEDISVMHGDDEVQELNDEIAELKEALNGSAVEEDENGFAVSDWFHEHVNKHIKFHLTEIGGEYNYIHTETGEHIFNLGSGGTLDEVQDYVAELKEKSLHMQNYLETREVKYCEATGCGRYCDEFADEISQRETSPSVSGPGLEWICKECQEDKATSAGWPS